MLNDELVTLTLRLRETRAADDSLWFLLLATALRETDAALAQLTAAARQLRCPVCNGDGHIAEKTSPNECDECRGTGAHPALAAAEKIIKTGIAVNVAPVAAPPSSRRFHAA